MLKQSTAYSITFFMVSSADHLAAKTGAAPVVNISKAAGAFAAAAGAVTEIANGWYKCALTNVDTNTLGDLSFHITGTGADDCDFREQVFAATTDDIAAYVDTEVAAIKAKTDQLTFTTANKVDSTIQAAGDFAQGAADKVWATAARTLTAFGFSVTVGTNNDKTGYSLSAAAIQAIWDALTSALTTVGSIGKLLVDNINATISSRSTYAGGDTAGTTTLLGRLTAGRATLLDNLDAAITSVKALLPAALVGGRIDASVGAMANGVITAAAHSVGAIDAAAVATDAVNEIRDAVTSAAVDGATTLAESLRLSNAALGGKVSGLATGAPVFRDLADTKDRITAVTDSDGNRTSVSRNLA